MAVGTTANHTVKRNKIVEQALRAVRAVKAGQQPDNNLMRDGVTLLNSILREEDNTQTGLKRSLWALSENHIFLNDGVYIYSSSNGLATNIQDIQSAVWRDRNGEDNPINYISPNQYEAIKVKNEVGDPTTVALVTDRTLASQTLRVNPVPTDVGTTSEVIGTDTANYQCILKHESSSDNRPITGASYSLFWKAGGSSGATWVTETDYTNGDLIRLSYKRPLFDFDLPDDDPDFPLGWSNYLKWRLAIEISPEFKVPLDERQWYALQLEKSLKALFPSSQVKTSDVHNKAKYF